MNVRREANVGLGAESPAFVIDGFNVLHACILRGAERERWWSQAAQRRLLDWLGAFSRRYEVSVWFDAKSPRSERCSNDGFAGQLHYAASADDAIVAYVERGQALDQLYVVSADRSLRDRCRHRGARVLSPWDFSALVEGRARPTEAYR